MHDKLTHWVLTWQTLRLYADARPGLVVFHVWPVQHYMQLEVCALLHNRTTLLAYIS